MIYIYIYIYSLLSLSLWFWCTMAIKIIPCVPRPEVRSLIKSGVEADVNAKWGWDQVLRREMRILQKVSQLLSQLAMWWVVSDRDMNPYKLTNFSPPLTTYRVVSYGKSCETFCGTNIAFLFLESYFTVYFGPSNISILAGT